MTFEKRLEATSFRGPCFDHVRLVAACIVLLHHCRSLQYSNIRDDFLLHFSSGFMDFGRLAVVIFFSISGFLVTPGLLRTASVIEFGVNRSLRIFPALVANVLLTMLILGPILTTHSLTSYYEDPQTYLYAKNILTSVVNYLPGVVGTDGNPASVNGALWTLRFEVLCYIVLGLFGASRLLSRRMLILAGWVATYATYVAIEMRLTSVIAQGSGLQIFVSLFVYFSFGIVIYLFRERIPFSAAWACAAAAMTLTALALGMGAVVMPICLPYLTMLCGLLPRPPRLTLKYDLSYGIYLIHAPMLLSFSLAFPRMHIWWVGAIVVFLVTMALAYASWIVIESPALRRKKAVLLWVQRVIASIVSPPKRAHKAEGLKASESRTSKLIT